MGRPLRDKDNGKLDRISLSILKKDRESLFDIAELYGESLSIAVSRAIRICHLTLTDSDKAALKTIRKARGRT